MEVDKLPNVKKYWINDGYLNIELKDNHRLRMNFNNIETLKEQLTLTDVVKSFYCWDEQALGKERRCQEECDVCASVRKEK